MLQIVLYISASALSLKYAIDTEAKWYPHPFALGTWHTEPLTTREGPEEEHIKEKEGEQGSEEGVLFHLLSDFYS